eukprot:TRINITY_DN864_c0_g1_i5.p1 TRINITY_DN864_c0_g1~~TRINITY_DN864_c0_g1_i5.p1  ORF type:complete len:304 (+),score=86.25 TRINITY_DN864_c0_g1_i5:680-1591(+)
MDFQARKRIMDVFLGGSGTVNCYKGNETGSFFYTYQGFKFTQLIMPYGGNAQNNLYVMSKRADIGLRHDNAGDSRYAGEFTDSTAFPAFVNRVWKVAPIILRASGDEDLSLIAGQARNNHACLLAQGKGWPASKLGEVKNIVSNLGYRLFLQKISYPSNVTMETYFNIYMEWVNNGTAPVYDKMTPFDVEFLFLSDNGDLKFRWTVKDNPPKNWMPNDDASNKSRIVISYVNEKVRLPKGSLKAGTYRTAVAVTSSQTKQSIRLGNAGRIDTRNFYLVSTIQVVSGVLLKVALTLTIAIFGIF